MQSGALWAVLFWTLGVSGGHCAKVIHVFVALADNAHQGIIPVPAKIGDGDKPDDNLYWGCDEGVRSWFAHSRRWKKIGTLKAAQTAVLERIVTDKLLSLADEIDALGLETRAASPRRLDQ